MIGTQRLLAILKPNGSPLTSTSVCSGSGPDWGFLEPVLLPVSGEYSVVVDPQGSNSATVNVSVYDITDVTDPIVPIGLPVPVTLSSPGQRAVLPFSGLLGHRMSVRVDVTSGGFGCQSWISIVKADGAVVDSTAVCSGSTNWGFLEPIALLWPRGGSDNGSSVNLDTPANVAYRPR